MNELLGLLLIMQVFSISHDFSRLSVHISDGYRSYVPDTDYDYCKKLASIFCIKSFVVDCS